MSYGAGKITVKESGLYFIYAQLYYNPPTTVDRHLIYVNGNVVALGHSDKRSSEAQTLYTSALKFLNVGDNIWVQVSQKSTVWMGASHSFFGAFLV